MHLSGIRLKLFGQFECALADGTPLSLQTRKAEVLLAYLALGPGIRHPRERLINLLWSDRSEDQARNSLRQALSTIKRPLSVLKEMPLEVDRTTVQMNASLVQVDALEFEQLSEATEIKQLAAAAALFQGEFLEGVNIRDSASQEWLAQERDRYKRMIVDVLTRLSAQQSDGGDFKSAIESAEALVAHDPLTESGWRTLMMAYQANNDRNHALLAYKRCHDVLTRELGVEPEAETSDLRERIIAGMTPSADSPESTKQNKEQNTPEIADPGSDGNAILVLPFENLSNDSDQHYFSEGITEGIIVGLSAYPSLTILSRHYSFAIREQKLSIGEISKTYGVRYIVEGSVRKTPQKLRITTQLVNTETGKQIWGKRYDSDLEKIFDIEDELTRTIVASIKGRMDSSDEDIAYKKPARDMSSYDLLMKGKYHLAKFNPKDNQLGREVLEKCIELDPDCDFAHNYLYRINILDWLSGWTEPRDKVFEKAKEHIEQAIKLGDGESVIQASYAEFLMFARDFEHCEDRAERAFRLNPNDTETLATLSTVHAGLGNVDLALEMADTCRTLDPFHPWIDWVNGIAYYTGKRYQDALETFKLMPNPPDEIEGWLAACYERLGQHTTAEKHLKRYVETVRKNMANPPTTLEGWHKHWQATSAAKHDYGSDYPFDALCDAGLEQYIEEPEVRGHAQHTPSVVVLPFDNLSGDSEQEYFSDGITESIILNLSKFPGLIVKSRNASFAFKAHLKSIGEISKELNVNYVVEGSIRKSTDRIRITVQLVDAKTGNQVWGNRYDSELDDIFELEEQLSRSVAATVTGRIESDLQKVALSKNASDKGSYDYLLAGIYYHNKYTGKDMVSAREHLAKCLEIDPDNFIAHCYLYNCHIMEWLERWTENRNESFKNAGAHCDRAYELNPNNDEVQHCRSEWSLFNKNPEKAKAHNEKALEINPNNAELYADKAFITNMLGFHEEAVGHARTAISVDPYNAWGHWMLAETLYNTGKFKEASEILIKLPDSPVHIQFLLCNCYMERGKIEKAQSRMKEILHHCQEVMKSMPQSQAEWREFWADGVPFVDNTRIDHQFDLLLEAGLLTRQNEFSVRERDDRTPSIVVLPFDNLSGDPEQEYFSDGITDSIILSLSSFSGMVVKSRHTSFSYKNSSKSIDVIAEEIGIQYAVEGSIRKAGKTVRINVQLIEANSGNQLWGKRYDENLEKIFELEQELSQAIAGTISGQITHDIKQTALRKPVKDLETYDLMMRSMYHVEKFTLDDLNIGRGLLNQCLERDPENAEVHTLLSALYRVMFGENWTVDRNQTLELANEHAMRAVELDPQNDFIQAFTAEHYCYVKKFDLAEQHADYAIEINPTHPYGYSIKGWALSVSGRYEDALECIETSMQLDPHHPYTGWLAGEVYRNQGEYEQAIKAFRTVPNLSASLYAQIAACYAGLDRRDKARSEMEKFHDLASKEMPAYPTTEDEWKSMWYEIMPYESDRDSERFFELLVKAGLIELAKQSIYQDNLSGFPTIAVLPFKNLSNDPEQEYFSDGISENIIRGLSMYKGLVVKSSQSSFAFRDGSDAIHDIADQLKADYIVDGSVRKVKKQIRLAAQLIESGTGNQIWGKHYDAELEDILTLEQELSEIIAGNISARLNKTISHSAIRKPLTDLNSYDYQMQGVYHLQKYTPESITKAKSLFKQSLNCFSENAQAYAYLGDICCFEISENWTRDRQETIAEYKRNMQKALELDSDNAYVHASMAECLLYAREFERAENHADRAIELNPTFANGYAMKSWALFARNQTQEWQDVIKKCSDLDRDNPYIPWIAAWGHCVSGDYENGISVVRTMSPIPVSLHLASAICFAGLDKLMEANAEIKKFHGLAREQMPNYPQSNIEWREYCFDTFTIKDDDKFEALYLLSLKAGLLDYRDNDSGETPSIAVLPFENLSGDPEQEYFSDGITSDIISTLSKLPKIQVVAFHSTSIYKNKKTPIAEIAEEQRARYILEGRIRKSDQKVRITAELIDSRDESIVWNETYDRPLDDVFEVQDEITIAIAHALRVQLTQGQGTRDRAKGTKSLKAWEYQLRAMALADSYVKEHFIEARRLIDISLEEDPEYAYAWQTKGWIEWQEGFLGPAENFEDYLDRAEAALKKSLECDPEDHSIYALKAFIHQMRRDSRELVKSSIDKAVADSPGDAEILALAASAYTYADCIDEAEKFFNEAVRRCPICPSWFYIVGGFIQERMGNWEQAIALNKRGIEAEPDAPLMRYWLANAYVETEQRQKAEALADEIRALPNKVTLDGPLRLFSYNQCNSDRVMENLAKVGLYGNDHEPSSSELPSIAVLPFQNLSGDPEQDFFSDGITSEIVSTLSRFRDIRVVAMHSTYGYKDSKPSISKIAEEQNARYLLEGRVQKSGSRIRINSELIDSTDESICWSDTYDRKLEDMFQVQDEITLSIASSLRLTVSEGDLAREKAAGTENLKAWEYTIRAGELSDSYVQSNIAEARRLIEMALEADPCYSMAWSVLGWINWQEAYISPRDAMAVLLDAAESAAAKSLELHEENALSILLQGYVALLRESDSSSAFTKIARAVESGPANVEVLAMAAWSYYMAQRTDEAFNLYEKAVYFSPIQPYWLPLIGAGIHQQMNDLEEATKLYRNSVDTAPDSPIARHYLIDAYIQAGKHNLAKKVAEDLLSLPHTVHTDGLIMMYSLDESARQSLRDNLESVGIGVAINSEDTGILPSIAVLPFENMSGDPEQQHFSDGITSDIISMLSRFGGMRVVSRHSTLMYQDNKTPVSQIAREQDVRYILDGSVRKSGEKIRVSAQLIDSNTEENVWVESFDRKLDDIFAVQDEITKNIAVAMRIRFREGERARDHALGTKSIKAWEYITRAADLSDSYIRSNIAEARRLAKLALELDPEYSFAWVILGWTHWQEAYCTWTDNIDNSIAEAEKAANRALEINPKDPEGLILLSTIVEMHGNSDEAIRLCEKAIAAVPGNSEANALMAYALIYAEEFEQAQSYYEISRRLSPICPNWYIFCGAGIRQGLGDFKQAIELLHEGISVEPESPLGYMYLIYALLEDGQEKEAKQVTEKVKKLDHTMGITGLVRVYSCNPDRRDNFSRCLNKMGFNG